MVNCIGSDFRQILRDRIDKKGRGTKRSIALKLRIHNSTLSQMLSGKRTISEDIAYQMIEHLEFTPQEREYLMLLHAIDRVSYYALKDFYRDILTKRA